LRALEQALRDVWEVLKAHDLHRDWDKDPETKEQVAEMLTGTWGSHVREQ
jgi:hypothetical protein